ncbi:hypothetical protein [Glaciihabitans sp. dw_435]|uniref:hypothetical protein n=1 Tax=Glaciihabitans sp. dw_435 TaxID=2720081 RepID=UPI001BD26F72|nr:hypothetical protein [Glaciihabitans sp. dw_435]
MNHFNAFGQRLRCLPSFRFLEGDENPGGDGATPKTPQEEGFDFPANTATAEMTPEQRSEYWRHKAHKHEKVSKSRDNYDELKAQADELTQLKKDQLTQQEKDLNDARAAGVLEGKSSVGDKYLIDAVTAKFQFLTGKSDDDVATAFAHVDAKSFTDAEGVIDTDKLTKFAATFGTKDAKGANPDPVAAALARGRQAHGGTGSSMAERREETRKSMSKTKK